MDLRKTPRLKQGDTIGIVAPSLYITDQETFKKGVDFLEGAGFHVQLGPNVRSRYENTTAPAAERAREVVEMFRRPDIKAIISLTGGGGAAELLELLDYDTIRRHPTIFSGQSDTTHLLLALLSKGGLVCLHGMELVCGFGAKPVMPGFNYSVELFTSICMSEGPIGPVPQRTQWECWRPGKADGRLVGGFLGILAGHAGGPYWPSLEKIILFWEAIAEDADQIVTDLRSLEAHGILSKTAGMIVGKVVGPPTEERTEALRAETRKRLLELTATHGFPIIGNADFGHCKCSFMPLPQGLLARVDASAISLEYLESMTE